MFATCLMCEVMLNVSHVYGTNLPATRFIDPGRLFVFVARLNAANSAMVLLCCKNIR